MIQAGDQSRVTASLFAIAGIVAWGVALAVAGVLGPGELFAGLQYLGLATVVASAVAFALNRYLWRRAPLKTLLQIPDLSGRWEGWTYRSFTREWRPSAEEFTQHALDIAANAWGPDNWARGLCASIVHDRHGGAVELVWSYITGPTTPNTRPGDSHTGTHFLRLCEIDGRPALEGRYVTDRVDSNGRLGAGGFVRLVWVSFHLKNTLAYNEASWPIATPTQAPILGAPPNNEFS